MVGIKKLGNDEKHGDLTEKDGDSKPFFVRSLGCKSSPQFHSPSQVFKAQFKAPYVHCTYASIVIQSPADFFSTVKELNPAKYKLKKTFKLPVIFHSLCFQEGVWTCVYTVKGPPKNASGRGHLQMVDVNMNEQNA